ncbi:MAG: YkgJ family cysteine cluster protein [Bacteroidetes bacterium]|nr:YkgJ family cysteine cluster protein [Bacteroidota bacterium]
MKVNLRSFKQKVRHNRKQLKSFLTKIGKQNSKGWDINAEKVSAQVWKEVDCLSCANCCKTMTPTFTNTDIKRIASHLNTTAAAFKKEWLTYDKKDKDWLNKVTPCQFLNLKTHKCNIYEVRPADCAGFPHFGKKKVIDYLHVHQQNVELCPATYKMVEKMQAILN